MSEPDFTLLVLLSYVMAVALLDFLAYCYCNKRWRRRERARTTLGVLVVLMPALPLALADLVDLWTWLIILTGFITAGAVTVFLDINTETRTSASLRQEIREIANHDQGHQ